MKDTSHVCRWHNLSISDYSTWNSDHGVRIPKRTGLLAEHPLLLMLVFSFWLQESWDIGGTQLYKWDRLASRSIKYYKALLLQGFKLLFLAYKVISEGKHLVLFCCALHAKNESVSSSNGNAFKCNYLELFAAKSPLPVVECSDFYLCRMPGLKPVKGPPKCWPSCMSGSCNLVGKGKSLFRNLWASKGAWLLTFGKRHHLYQQLA